MFQAVFAIRVVRAHIVLVFIPFVIAPQRFFEIIRMSFIVSRINTTLKVLPFVLEEADLPAIRTSRLPLGLCSTNRSSSANSCWKESRTPHRIRLEDWVVLASIRVL